MKTLYISLLLLVCTLNVVAQNDDTESIQATIDACIAMRDAVAANDSAAIKQSAAILKDCKTSEFLALKCKDDSIASLNGHLVFDEEFADSLAEGKDVFADADSHNRARAKRGHKAGGKVFTKTCFVKAGESTKYTFLSEGHQEIAVVAEAGGLVTMKIHVTNDQGFDKNFNDTEKVKIGMPHRKRTMELPNCHNLVELVIINCGRKDCSFVVISN